MDLVLLLVTITIELMMMCHVGVCSPCEESEYVTYLPIVVPQQSIVPS